MCLLYLNQRQKTKTAKKPTAPYGYEIRKEERTQLCTPTGTLSLNRLYVSTAAGVDGGESPPLIFFLIEENKISHLRSPLKIK